MQANRILLKISAGVMVAVFVVIVAQKNSAYAQNAGGPQFVMTWSASNSYVPVGYSGKILPNPESQITAALELIANGQPINLSNQTIYWYLNDNLLGGGEGVQHFTFHPYGTAPANEALKVELPDYPGGELLHEITIPLVTPVAVAEAPYANGQFSQIPLVLMAMPYFFNASSVAPLSFSWSVNGQAVTSAENPQSLKISLPQSTPAGFAVGVTLNVKDSFDNTTANSNINLTYQPQP
jgi:hypothetical protein